jgi:hypothetical protein
MRKSILRAAGAAMVACTALAGAGIASARVAQSPAWAAPVDTKSVAVLAAAIRTELGHQPSGASTEDLEGAIVFALSQSDFSREVIGAALNSLRNDPGQIHLKTAVNNVQLALLKKWNRGTAALNPGGGGLGGGYSNFSPLLGPGGGGGNGSSNYSS